MEAASWQSQRGEATSQSSNQQYLNRRHGRPGRGSCAGQQFSDNTPRLFLGELRALYLRVDLEIEKVCPNVVRAQRGPFTNVKGDRFVNSRGGGCKRRVAEEAGCDGLPARGQRAGVEVPQSRHRTLLVKGMPARQRLPLFRRSHLAKATGTRVWLRSLLVSCTWCCWPSSKGCDCAASERATSKWRSSKPASECRCSTAPSRRSKRWTR
jgi:hypothetical protein